MLKTIFIKIKNLLKSKWKLFLGLLIIIALVIVGFRLIGARSKKNDLKTTTVKKKDIAQIISASGKIKSDEEATLKFQTSGRLSWVGVKEGDKVKKWQAIASLDKKELEKELKQELLDYMNERWDFEQTSMDDYRDQALTETIRRVEEKAQFDLDRVVLDVEIADIALKYSTLITPIEGIVTEIEAPYAGVNITPATAEFVVSNPDKLIFSANVDEVDIATVKKGQKGILFLDAYLEEEIKTQVEQVEFTSTTTSGGGTAFRVKFQLPPNTAEEKFKLGMNGDVEIFIEEKKDILVVPFETVQEDDQGTYVWLMKENKPVRQPVKTGISNDVYTEIVEGLQEKDKVIISGLEKYKF